MKKYLVIGNPIDHSMSPLIHNYWMKKYHLSNSIYDKKKVEEKDLKNIIQEIKDNKIIGMNVTVPFKKLIIPFLDKLNPIAEKTESVNTVLKINNQIMGYNTDQPGFNLTVEELFPNNKIKGKTVFILGAGGVTSSIIHSLENKDVEIIISNRTRNKAEELKKKYKKIEVLDWGKRPTKCDVVINTTSIGLKKNEKINLNFDDCEGCDDKLFYDLIYNPQETVFLKEARLRGNKVINGQKMFLYQAKYAFDLWMNIKPEIDDEIIKFFKND
jgi:shikimate dehydrogenase